MILATGNSGVALALGGLLALWASYQLGQRAGRSARGRTAKQVFVLAVGLKFPSEQARDQFLEIWRPLAKFVEEHEPTTYSFQWLVADTDPTKVLVYERYKNKDVFTSIHRKSEPFLAFSEVRTKLPFKVEITGQSYYETEDGFM